MREVIKSHEIEYVESVGLKIGISIFEMAYIFGITGEKESTFSEIYKTTIRFKNSQYEGFRLNEDAYKKLLFIFEEYKLSKNKEKIDEQIKYNKPKLGKLFGINYSFWILYLILVLGFFSKSFGEDIEQKEFQYKFIYDVNKDICVDSTVYDTKFTYEELMNPKFVGEFQKRPGELVFINNNDEMYVFTDTLERCKNYRDYFISEMLKQLSNEESRIDSFNIE